MFQKKVQFFLMLFLILSKMGSTELPFQAVPYFRAINANQAVTADLNNDQIPDMALVGNEGGLSVMLGDGQGGLATPDPPTLDTSHFRSVVTGRFDEDQFMDLATVSFSSPSLALYINRGNGTFAPAIVYKLKGLALGIAAGDVNGDGVDDIAVTITGEPSGYIQVFLGRPSGTLQNFRSITIPAPTSVAFGHFNADPLLDLAVTSYHEGAVAILRGNGNGEFTLLAKSNASTGATKLIVLDFDRDGRDDVVVLNIYNQVVFARNAGNNWFESPRIFQLNGVREAVVLPAAGSRNPSIVVKDGYDSIVIFTKTPSGYSRHNFLFSGTGAMAVGDWDGDGRPELAVNVADFNSSVAYMALIQTSGNTLRIPGHLNFAFSNGAFDFNQDGHQDLLGSKFFMLGSGNGQFEKQLIPFDIGDGIVPAYLNDDGAPDIAVIRLYGQSAFRLNDRHGNFGRENPLSDSQQETYRSRPPI